MERYTSLVMGQGGLTFPLTKTVLWNHEPRGQRVQLHLTANQTPQVCIDNPVLQLAHKYAEDSGSYLCSLIGSLIPDGAGLQVHVDRFEPDWNDSGLGSAHNNSVTLIPGDIAIPCYISKGDENQTPVADYIATLRTLQKRLAQNDRCGLHSFLTLKAACCVTRSQEVRVEFDLVTLTTRLLATPVASVPLLGTPLCRNLLSPLNMGELLGESKMGYMTMDHTRKLIVIMDTDPKVQNLPLVGIWATGVEDVSDPYVWCACLKYIHCCSLKDRICLPPEPFLIVLFSSEQQHPQFFEITVDSSDLVTQYQLNAGLELVNLGKNHPDTSRRGVEVDLIRIENGPKFEAFASATEQMTVIPERETPRKFEELVPRATPAPQQLVKSAVTSPLHEVPEVSLLGEENFEKISENRVPMTYFKKRDKENCRPKDFNNQGQKSSKSRQKADTQPLQSQVVHIGQRPRSPVLNACFQQRYQSPPQYYQYSDAYGGPVYQQSYPYQGQYYNKPYRVPQGYYTSPPQPIYRAPRNQPVRPYGPTPFRPGYGRGMPPVMIPNQNQMPQAYSGPMSPSSLANQAQFGLAYLPNAVDRPTAVSLPQLLPSTQCTPVEQSSARPSASPAAPKFTQAPSLQTYSIDHNGTHTTITTTPDVYELIRNQDAQLKFLQQQLQLLLDAQKNGCKEESVEKVRVEIPTEKVQQASVAINTSLMITAPQNLVEDSETSVASGQTETTELESIGISENAKKFKPVTRTSQTTESRNSTCLNSNSMFSSCTTSTLLKSEKASSNSDSIQFSLHMTALQDDSLDTTSESDIIVDLPGYEYSNESPAHGEESPVIQSVSMYDAQSSEHEMTRLQLEQEQEQVHEQVIFYEKLIDNIQTLLEGGPAKEARAEAEASAQSAATEIQPTRDLALEALEQLRQMTLDMKTEEDQESGNSLCEMEAAVLQKINYVSMMFEDSGDTNMSMEVNALAVKYLGEENHNFTKRVTKPSQCIAAVQSTVFGGTNMSFATRKYMERHGLIDSFAASRLQSVPEAPDSSDITILRDIQPLKIPVMDWRDETPEKDKCRRIEESHLEAKVEHMPKYEPGAYSGSNSMFLEKAVTMPQSITESQHQRRISSWCRRAEPSHSSCINVECSCVSVSDFSGISHWEKRAVCEGVEDTTFCSGVENCEVKPYESTPAVGKRSTERRTPTPDGVRRKSLDSQRTPETGRRTPVLPRHSSDGRRKSIDNLILVDDNRTDVSSSSHSSLSSHASQDQPVKDENYRVFDRPAREVQPLPPITQSFIDRERDIRAIIQDVSAQDNILDIDRLKQLPKLL